MPLQPFTRARIASWSIASLVLGALTVIAPAAHAAAGPVNASDFSFQRSSADGHSFVVKPNEEASLGSETSVDSTWTGWPLAKGTVLSRNAFTVTTLPAGVEQYDWGYRNWNMYSSTDPESCPDFNSGSASLKITTAMTCLDIVSVFDSIPVANTGDSTVTVDTNADDLRIKYGKKAIGETASRVDSAYAYITSRGGDSITISESENYLSLGFGICLAEEDLNVGDELTLYPAVTKDGNPVTNYLFSDWSDELTGDEGSISGVTYTVPEPVEGDVLENIVVRFGINLDETTAATYAGSVDIKKGDTSVTEPCPTYDTAWPTITTVDGVDGSPAATVTSRVMPADTFSANDNFDQYSSHPDGFGGMFYWGYPGADWESNGNSAVTLVHLNPSGPNDSFAGNGSIVINSDKDGFFDIARFGEDGENWYTFVSGNKGAYKMTSGTMAASTVQTYNLTGKALSALCGKGFSATYLSALSATTTSPVAILYCADGAIRKNVLVKIVAGKPSAITTLGVGTKARPCVALTFGTDTRASGAQQSIIVYSRVSSKDAEGNCGSWGATVSSRSITTVTAALVATTTKLTSNPWAGRDEPAFLEIAAGQESGTWFGVTNEMTDVYSPHTATQLFSMTGTAITIKSEITTDDTTDFGDWFLVSPLYQTSSTEWTLMIDGAKSFDGENIGRATVATINPNTGVITNGDIVESTDMGYFSGRMVGRFSFDSSGSATWYAVTSPTAYKTAVWGSGLTP